MLLHNPTKLPPIDRFEEISKDATTILHARHFLSLDNLKVSSNPGFAGYALWHSESFPGQPCACGERSTRSCAAGEGVQASRQSLLGERPLTPTLSPQERGE